MKHMRFLAALLILLSTHRVSADQDATSAMWEKHMRQICADEIDKNPFKPDNQKKMCQDLEATTPGTLKVVCEDGPAAPRQRCRIEN
ncbi:MAG: hypothetical protein JO001_02640 [Alphaproteobacteria bacterium]|nr:hypothetical protein [Alphaproteobacteria bacterium]